MDTHGDDQADQLTDHTTDEPNVSIVENPADAREQHTIQEKGDRLE